MDFKKLSKIKDSLDDIQEPSAEDLYNSMNDPELISELIEQASDGKNKVKQFIDNEDGTISLNMERAITPEEARFLREVGVQLDLSALNRGGWVTVSTSIMDSNNLEQFIMNLLIKKKAKCPKSGDWEIKGEKVFNNGKEVISLPNDLPVEQAIDRIKDYMSTHKISDELKPGDEYNDGTYSGKVKEVSSDKIVLSSQDEAGNEVSIEVPIKDSALRAVKESNITDILDKGETTVVYNPKETNPSEIVSQIEDELSQYLEHGEDLPELEVEVLSDNKISIFVS